MAESNLPKQDFAPPWLKFPSADSSKSPNQNGYSSERSRQRREDPYHSRSDYNRLYRQNSFDFIDAKCFPQGQGKYRHHSIDDDYYNYYGGYGYYPPNYNYEQFGMQYVSQLSPARTGNQHAKHPPGRSPQTPAKRGYTEKEHHKDSRDLDVKVKERSDRGKPFSEDFPLLKGSGENTPEAKQTKPGSGVWDNPPKSSRNESPDLQKTTSPGVYKALVLNRNGQTKMNGPESARSNGRHSSPLSPSNKSNHKEGLRQSPTSDLAIVTQPKKLGDKKSEFLRAMRHESNLQNGETYQDVNQNSIVKKPDSKEIYESHMNENVRDARINGSCENKSQDSSCEIIVNDKKKKIDHNMDRSLKENCNVNGGALMEHLNNTYLSMEAEEKRLLESMGWSEEDQTEYVITDDDVKDFQRTLIHALEQFELGNVTRHGILRLKHFANYLLNHTYVHREDSKQESL